MLGCNHSDIINVNMIAFNVFNVLPRYYISSLLEPVITKRY